MASSERMFILDAQALTREYRGSCRFTSAASIEFAKVGAPTAYGTKIIPLLKLKTATTKTTISAGMTFRSFIVKRYRRAEITSIQNWTCLSRSLCPYKYGIDALVAAPFHLATHRFRRSNPSSTGRDRPFSDSWNAAIAIVTILLYPILFLGSTLYIKSTVLLYGVTIMGNRVI